MEISNVEYLDLTPGSFKMIQSKGIKRVVIDAIGDLMLASSDPQRLHDYLYALIQHFTVAGVTSFLNFETNGGITEFNTSMPGGRFSYISDNIILLSVNPGGSIKRTVTILKSRGTAHDLDQHPAEITKNG